MLIGFFDFAGRPFTSGPALRSAVSSFSGPVTKYWWRTGTLCAVSPAMSAMLWEWLRPQLTTCSGAITPNEVSTRLELKALIDDGVLNPASSVAALRLVCRLPDAIDLLADLKSLAATSEASVEGWETISMAKNRSGRKTDQILTAIRGGHVRLGRQPDRANYTDLLVGKSELDEFVRQVAPEPGPILISASKSCREIGLLDAQNFYALFAAGHTPAVRMKNPKTDAMQINLTSDDIAGFLQRFVTIRSFAKARGAHRNSVRPWIKQAKIIPYSPNGEDFGLIFLRKVVETALL